MSAISRNSPCPCGSGKKYKQCCLGLAEPAQSATGQLAHKRHATERVLSDAILAWTDRRYGESWFPGALQALEAIEPPTKEELPFIVPWLTYHHVVEGQVPAAGFLAHQLAELSEFERTILESNLSGRMSFWEVRRVEPGEGIELFDLLTQETRFVHDVLLSRGAQRWTVFLAIVVDYPEVCVVGGLHPRPLLPVESAEPLTALRRLLGVRTRAVARHRLLNPEVKFAMLMEWRMAVAAQAQRQMAPRIVSNTDGEPLVLCVDRFEVSPKARLQVLEMLSTIKGAEREPGDDGDHVVFTRPGNRAHKDWQITVIGRARLDGRLLLVESNSVGRADALRESIERVAGSSLRHRSRDKRDAKEMIRQAAARPAREAARTVPPPTVQAAIREMLERHYATWVDTALPALEGRTPRQAAVSAKLRPRLVALLKEFEYQESRKAEYERYDMRGLWAVLQLDPEGHAHPKLQRVADEPTSLAPRPRAAIPVLELTVSLRGVEPRVWRRLRVRSNTTLMAFHKVLQDVMGWTDSHLHLFRARGIEYGERDPELPEIRSEKGVRLGSLMLCRGDRVEYEYDFGDSWVHDIELEQILEPDPGPGKFPFVLDGARACPPEDCGGAPGYEDLLQQLGDANSPDHEHLVEWVGGTFDPEAFDARAINGKFHRDWVLPDDPRQRKPRSATALPRRAPVRSGVGKVDR